MPNEIPLAFLLIAVLVAVVITILVTNSIHDEHVNESHLFMTTTIAQQQQEADQAGATAKDKNTNDGPSSSERHFTQRQLDLQEDLTTENQKQGNMGGGPGYHVVFSTACSAQQHWESYVLFYHAWRVRQPGNVTRIASGCKPHEASALQEFHQTVIQTTLSTRFYLHLTPDYSRVRLDHGKFAYKYMNKPFGLRHWMEHTLGYSSSSSSPNSNNSSSSVYDDDIVMLMDPDMILTKPLTHDFSPSSSSNDGTIWVDKPRDPTRWYVRHGNPMAQQDGYLNSKWLHLNVSYITNDTQSPVWGLTARDGVHSYNTGPPYLATARDMYRIAIRWTEYAPRVFDVFPKLFAEMFGYCFATAQLRLPHTLVKSLVLSTTMTNDREGWPLVDQYQEPVCPFPDNNNNNNNKKEPHQPLPTILHYCKRYMVGRFFWSKYRLRKDYLSCEAPLLTVPPPNITQVDWWLSIPTAGGDTSQVTVTKLKNAKTAKREAFMICGMIGKVNEAVEHFKRKHCGDKANFNHTYNFHDDPGKHR